ncbi:MAG: GGDEF domain-containing protein [Pseudomonadales bacterium]
MRRLLATVWGQILVFTVACCAASVAIMAAATWAVTGTLELGLGLHMSILIPALLVPIGSYWHVSLTHRLRRANEQLKRLSETDPLTGTFNRRRFLEVAERQLLLARRHGYPTSLLLLDFDRFKDINDRFGHAGGDHVLRDATAAIAAALRESDVLARFGGEEFIVLLPHTAAPGAELVAERVMRAVRDHTFEHDGQPIHVTVSIGGVGCSASSTPLDRLTSRADTLLYEAKHAGRDRCRIETVEAEFRS